jgi:uncharacterized membrane protein YidH (DUF202 family)
VPELPDIATHALLRRDGDAAEETEPDNRFTLANERTFLVWERTSLGLLALAVAIVQFVPQFGIPGARHVFGAFLTILAMLSAGFGLHRWREVDRAMRRGRRTRHRCSLDSGWSYSACWSWELSSSRQSSIDSGRPGALLILKDVHHYAGPMSAIAAGLAGIVAVAVYVVGLRRQRTLARRPLPDRITASVEVQLIGVAVPVLIVVTALGIYL